jgi:hypothetical protein
MLYSAEAQKMQEEVSDRALHSPGLGAAETRGAAVPDSLPWVCLELEGLVT